MLKPASFTCHLVLFCFALGLAADLFAKSCQPFEDSIYGFCSLGRCESVIYVPQHRGFGDCSARPVIEPAPPWVQPALEFELTLHGLDEAGIYALRIFGRPVYGEPHFAHVEEYIALSQNEKKRDMLLVSLARVEHKTIEELRGELGRRERNGYWLMVALQVADWLALVAGFGLLAAGVVQFNRWLRRERSVWVLLLITSLQLLLLAVAIYSLTKWLSLLIGWIAIFVPGIWFYEVVAALSAQFGRKLTDRESKLTENINEIT